MPSIVVPLIGTNTSSYPIDNKESGNYGWPAELIIMAGQDVLWFTTSTSVAMMEDGSASLSGLYQCSFDRETGTCHSPQEIATGWFRDGRFHYNMALMNVQLDDTRTHIYSRTRDKKRKSWEIIRSPVDTINFESYLRTNPKIEWNECDWDCCEDTGQTYVQVAPKTFLADGNDVFVTWDGFYKDCTDIYTAAKSLVWTVGISKLKKDNDCILNGGDHEVNFATCSDPVSIVYQNATGRSRVVPYGGFATARSSTGRRMFFMTILHSEGIDDGKITSEVWVTPEGAEYATSPGELQTLGAVQVLGAFFDQEIQDVGSIRLHLNNDGAPDHLCRTIFDVGVSCFPFALSQGDRVSVTDEAREFVTSDMVYETCHLSIYKNKPYYNRIFTVTTGLEVLWDPLGNPEKIIFGCYGEAGGNGNFTTVDRDGNMVQTVHGAYPGSIMFGTQLPDKKSGSDTDSTKAYPYLWTHILLFSAVLMLALMFAYRIFYGKLLVRVSDNRVYAVDGRESDSLESPETEEVSVSNSGSFAMDNRLRTSYFELSTLETNDTNI
jgi:hypothetical protein